MRNLFLLGLLIVMSAACLLGQQQRSFDWVRASDEIVQLDPMEFHAGRVYRPGPDGGNMYVIVSARQPVTLAMNMNGAVVVEGNLLHLKRLVINLIDNAIKFTPAYGKIEIGAAARDGHARLRITDSGPGIPAEELPLIFDRFFRA